MSETMDITKLAAGIKTCEVVEAPNGSKHVVSRTDYEVTALPQEREGKRAHEFDDVQSFAEWMVKHGDPANAEVLVGPDTIRAVLKPAEGEPEVVTCRLVAHPAFKAWVDVLDHDMRLAGFLDLARGFSEYVVESDELLAALRGFKLIRGGEFTQTIDEMGAVRLIGTSEKADVSIRIPPELLVDTPVFTGIGRGDMDLVTYELHLFVSMTIGEAGNHVTFKLSCPGLPLVMKEARDDAAAFAREKLGDAFLVGLGEMLLDQRDKVD